MAGVILRGLSKTYPGGVQALKSLDLDVRDGELLVLLGPSGCGKTTLLRLLAGLEAPSHGVIRIGSRMVNPLPPWERDVAMVFQSGALYPHLSVAENLAFGLRLRGSPHREIAQRVDEAARWLGLDDLRQRRPDTLSGGQRQRVAIGRALVRRPAVYLLDEPLSGLDAQLRLELRRELKALHQRLGTTMLLVTHDQAEALALADRIAVLRDGSLQQVGPPAELYHQPSTVFVAGFLGSPPCNLVPGKFQYDGERLAFWPEDGPAPWSLPPELSERLKSHAGQAVLLGVRPENLHVRGEAHPTPALFRGRVELVEELGAEQIWHCRIGPHGVRLRRGGAELRMPPGGEVELIVDLHKLHFFDAATGQSLHRA